MATIGASYFSVMSRALPGQVSDTSAYNIDGACVLDSTDAGGISIMVGVAVKHGGVDSVGNKVVKPITGGGDSAYGVAIRSHFQTSSIDGRMVYENGSGINVMTEGRVWMLANDSQEKVAYDTAVKLDTDGKVNTASGTITTDWLATGDFTEYQGLKLIEVKLFGA